MPTDHHRTAPRFLPVLICILLSSAAPAAGAETALSAREKLDLLQRQCFGYFWDGGDPVTGMAYEASREYPAEGRPLAVGGTGFGLAAVPAAAERGWITREEAAGRVARIVRFLRDDSPRKQLHGAFPHWLHRETGGIVRFSELDDGADIVETALLVQGLLIARAYFDAGSPEETALRVMITEIWEDIEWDWFADGEDGGLFWHWSPNHGFTLGLKVQGFNECLIAYVLAMASPGHAISRAHYDHWSAGDGYETRDVFGYRISAAVPGGGPLFFTHYSFIGLDPRRLADREVPEGYFIRNTRQALSNRGYCLYEAPAENRYAEDFWGLTASTIPDGYAASDPLDDRGTIAPTAALASLPYTPYYSFQVLGALLGKYRSRMWGEYGPYDAMSLRDGWFSSQYLAIDQLPIACMAENYRSGLLWRLFMSDADVKAGLEKAGFAPPQLPDGFPEAVLPLERRNGRYFPGRYSVMRHPDDGRYHVPYFLAGGGAAVFELYADGRAPVCLGSAASQPGSGLLRFDAAGTALDTRASLVMRAGATVYVLPVILHGEESQNFKFQ